MPSSSEHVADVSMECAAHASPRELIVAVKSSDACMGLCSHFKATGFEFSSISSTSSGVVGRLPRGGLGRRRRFAPCEFLDVRHRSFSEKRAAAPTSRLQTLVRENQILLRFSSQNAPCCLYHPPSPKTSRRGTPRPLKNFNFGRVVLNQKIHPPGFLDGPLHLPPPPPSHQPLGPHNQIQN